jgi:hypothetical protein
MSTCSQACKVDFVKEWKEICKLEYVFVRTFINPSKLGLLWPVDITDQNPYVLSETYKSSFLLQVHMLKSVVESSQTSACQRVYSFLFLQYCFMNAIVRRIWIFSIISQVFFCWPKVFISQSFCNAFVLACLAKLVVHVRDSLPQCEIIYTVSYRLAFLYVL